MRLLTDIEQDFLIGFFRSLRDAGIRNAFARNADDFPAAMGNDIDLLIEPRHKVRGEAIFRDCLRKAGGELWQRNPREYVLDLRFCLPGTEVPIHLDLYWGVYTWHGLTYADAKDVLADAIQAGETHYTVRPADEALAMYSASLLWGGFYKAKYGDRMRQTLQDPVESKLFEEDCREAYGPEPLPVIPGTEVLPSAGEARRAGRELQRRLKAGWMRRSPVKALGLLARYWLLEFATVVRPSGLCLRVPSGSTADQLADKFGPVFEGVSRVAPPRGGRDAWKIRKLLAQSVLVIVVADPAASASKLKWIAGRAFLDVGPGDAPEFMVREWLVGRYRD